MTNADDKTRAPGRHEGALTVIAFLAGAAPIFMLLLGGMAAMMSMGMSMADVVAKPPDPKMREPMMHAIHGFMRGYLPLVLVPALVVLVAIWIRARNVYPRLANKIGAGLAAGFLATFGLDAVRLIGVAPGAFPGDMPTMFGQMITGRMETSAAVLVPGYAYHFLNGATFGLMFNYRDACRKAGRVVHDVQRLAGHLREVCVGQLGEIFDAEEPHRPRGPRRASMERSGAAKGARVM